MNTIVLLVCLLGSTLTSATDLTCNDLVLLRVILRQDIAADAYAARANDDDLAKDRAAPLSRVLNDPNSSDLAELQALVSGAGSDEYKRLNAARVLAYFGYRQGVDILSKTAAGDFAQTSSCFERSKAALCLVYLGCDLPVGFAFSRMPNPLYSELDIFVKKSASPVDPNAPHPQSEIETIIGDYVGLGRSVEVRGPLTVAEVEHDELVRLLCDIVTYHDRRSIPRVPFAYINAAWQEFKNGMREGDLIYFFTSDEYSWRALFGIEGYALIRDGEVVDIIVTAMS